MTAIGKSAGDVSRKDYCFERIENASQHLLGVINDVLDMSKIEAGKFELSYVEFDFEKMLQRVVNIVSFRTDEKKQKLSVHIDKSIPRTLIGDDQRLAQVITNLLGNAVKFTEDEGTIKLDARFVGEEGGVSTIRLTVQDDGIGISPEQHEKLFNSFQQAEKTMTRRFGGTGLGLAISKGIVERMGGQFELESELGKGSSFSFTFKAKRGSRRNKALPGIDWNNVSIMAVDDDRDVLEHFNEIMRGFGTHIDTAESAREALSYIEKNGAHNIYFVDWKMPDMDGIELVKALKSKSEFPNNSVIIMISAAEWSNIADEATKAGVDKFLSKPLFPSAIADAITEAIGIGHYDDAKQDGNDGIFMGCNVLLAEDVEINREIVSAIVEPTGLKLHIAENGAEAVEKYVQDPEFYNLILMDVQMPEMDGYAATRAIRALGVPQAKAVPIIAMTANVFREDIEKCLAAGMNGHLGKPIDVDELFLTLRKYLSPKGS
jgi:CheY-like chemotaxis protein